jgi:cystathionine beta-lyase/cystathionine gamma-synthase
MYHIAQVSLFYADSPSNPLLNCLDIKSVSELCHSHGALVCIDSTLASPINQKPLTLGADLVLHSATKYISGHHDVGIFYLNYITYLQVHTLFFKLYYILPPSISQDTMM